MDINELKSLIDQFDQSTLKELKFEEGTTKVAFSKNDYMAPAPTLVAGPEVTAVASPQLEKVAEEVAVVEIPAKISGEVVVSPLVGTFYLKPSPDDDDFIAVGEHVVAGQTLCIIEAMKVMNEIPAPVSGVVKSIFVDPAGIVEFDQPLVEIQEGA